MTKEQIQEILDRVLTWPAGDQDKLALFVRELEDKRADDGLTDDE